MTGTHIVLLLLGGCSTDDWCTRFNLDCGATLPEIVVSVDADEDVWSAEEDCDDSDPTVNPSAIETWYDGVDQDCAGDSDWDADGDGYDASWRPDGGGEDCDDGNPDVNPGATERWYDGIDDDCDGNLDDADGDGQAGQAAGGLDCDDADPSIYFGAPETWYDGIDQDCNPSTEYDADGDGWDSIDHGGADCDDASRFTSPEQVELCDGRDNDCDGQIDQDGVCAGAVQVRTILGIDPRAPEIWTTPNLALAMDADDDGEPELMVSSESIENGRAWAVPVAGRDEAYVSDAVSRVQADGGGQGLGMSPVAGTDLDGDGHADLVLGGLDPDENAFTNRGAVWTFFGPLSGSLLASDADGLRAGPTSGALLGRLIRGHGDLDGDGLPDLLAMQENGAALEDGGEGTALLLLPGATTGRVDVTEDTTAVLEMDIDGDGSSDWWVTQTDPSDAADLDGDGVLDLVLGLPYLGTAGGVGVHLGPVDSDRVLPDVVAAAAGDAALQAGWSVVHAGDLDGDGAPELAVGVPAAGPSTNGEVWLLSADDVLAGDLEAPLGAVRGPAFESLGTHLSRVGDLDGDGTVDLVASRQYEPVRLIAGSARGAGDIEEDDKLVPEWVPGLGYAHRARAVGDLDGDGQPEILVALVPSTAVGLLLDGDGWSGP
jgi:hypothetical protein